MIANTLGRRKRIRHDWHPRGFPPSSPMCALPPQFALVESCGARQDMGALYLSSPEGPARQGWG